jgi:nucleotide-binding universal stress UspA family protein
MKRFKNILVVFDSKTDNQALFYQAVDLAQKNNAFLMVIDVIEETPQIPAKPINQELANDAKKPKIHIIEDFPIEIPSPPAFDFPGENGAGVVRTTEEPSINVKEFITQVEQRNLQMFVSEFQHAGIRVNSKTVYGIPFIKIIQEVLRDQYDLVMVTAEGREGVMEVLFGNTTMHLMRKCPCPVWVIKPGQPRKFNRILAAVNMVQEDNEPADLVKKIMDLATSLARSYQSELLILHAWSMYGESVLRGRAGISEDSINKLLQETHDTHLQWIYKLLQQYPLDDIVSEVYLLKGDAGDVINELVRAKSVDLVVMGTVSRGGLSGLLIGNTAEKVLRQVNCSVLTIKPNGFITPVKPESA